MKNTLTPDRINALLEYAGIFFALYNCAILLEDGGKVSGVSIASIGFFTVWGMWNLYYYPLLGQSASAFAALGLVISNGTWLIIFSLYATQTI